MTRFSRVVAPFALAATCLGAFLTANASAPAGGSFSVDTDRFNNSTYVLGENVLLRFNVTGLAPSKPTTLAITVVNEFGVTIHSTAPMLTADTKGNAYFGFVAPSTEYGYYRVQATLPNGATIAALGTRPAGFISYAVIPDPSQRVNYGDAGSRFGFCGGFNTKQGNILQLLGAHYLLDGPGWSTLEPDYAGQFAQARNQAVADGQSYPFHLANNNSAWPTYAIETVMTKAEPTWAFVPGTGTADWPTMGVLSAAGQTGFSAYTKERAVVASQDFSKQSARYYQITWEPEVPAGFGGTPAQLVEFYKLAHAAIHSADPHALVMGPTMLAIDDTSLPPLYAAGLAQYIDAVSVHPYAHWPVETNGLQTDLRTQIQMATTAKGAPMPFVSTEHGLSSGEGTTLSAHNELNQALGNIRSTLIILGEGFKIDFAFYTADYWNVSSTETAGTFGYYWNLDPAIAFGTDKVGPKPAVPAYAAMTNFLDGTTTVGPVSQAAGTQIGYRFKKGTSTILALWDYEAATSIVTIPVPAGQVPKVCDWMGNCRAYAPTNGTLRVHVSASPTYVVAENI